MKRRHRQRQRAWVSADGRGSLSQDLPAVFIAQGWKGSHQDLMILRRDLIKSVSQTPMETGQTFPAAGTADPGPNPGLASSRRQQPHARALGTPAAPALPIALSPGSLRFK